MTVICIRVVRVKHKPDFSRRCYFMLVSHIHEIIFQGQMVMVFEAAWRELSSDDFDVGLWKSCTWISS